MWSPLAGGLLSGKHRRNKTPARARGSSPAGPSRRCATRTRSGTIVDELVAIGDARGVSAAQIALAWLLGRPAVTSLVIGGRTEAQFRDNLASVERQADRRRARASRQGEPAAADLPLLASVLVGEGSLRPRRPCPAQAVSEGIDACPCLHPTPFPRTDRMREKVERRAGRGVAVAAPALGGQAIGASCVTDEAARFARAPVGCAEGQISRFLSFARLWAANWAVRNGFSHGLLEFQICGGLTKRQKECTYSASPTAAAIDPVPPARHISPRRTCHGPDAGQSGDRHRRRQRDRTGERHRLRTRRREGARGRPRPGGARRDDRGWSRARAGWRSPMSPTPATRRRSRPWSRAPSRPSGRSTRSTPTPESAAA